MKLDNKIKCHNCGTAVEISSALQALKDLAPELDEQALKNYDRLHFGVGEHGVRYRCLLQGARWAHDQLKAKLALAESQIGELEQKISEVLPQDHVEALRTMNEYNQLRIAELEAEAKRYREALELIAEDYVREGTIHKDCPDCDYDGFINLKHHQNCVYVIASKALGHGGG